MKKHIIISLSILLFLTIGILLVVLVSRKNQEYREHAAGPTTSTVLVNITQQIGSISQNYVGISTGNFCPLIHIEAAHPEIDTYFKNLAPTVMRIGGNNVDATTWNPSATCPPTGNPLTMGQAMINEIFAIAKKDNMKVIWNLNLKANQPTISAQEAAYVVQAGGSNLLALEIGNEPDLYTGMSYQMYKAEWESYYTAIKARVPSAPIEGPDIAFGIKCATCGSSNLLGEFLNDEASKIQFSSFHSYFLYPAISSMQNLLDATNMTSKVTVDMGYDVTAAKTAHVPIYLTETNSDGSTSSGVGNVFASALWGLDYLFTTAETGISEINIFGDQYPGPVSGNEPIAINATGTLQAQSLYYAMLLFHNLAQGNMLVKTTTHSSINLVTHAVVSSDGKLQIFLINKDQTNDTTAQVSIPAGYVSGTDIRMQAPSVTSQTGITLGGSTIAENGTWTAATTETVTVTNNSFTISVPHASAVAVTLVRTNTSLSPSPESGTKLEIG